MRKENSVATSGAEADVEALRVAEFLHQIGRPQGWDEGSGLQPNQST